jgi:peptide/nickel transport system ATP-binding protein
VTLATVSGLTIRPATAQTAVVSEADLEVNEGEVLALAGPSGTGKTTLGLALLGYVRPGLERVAGRVRVAGHDPFTREGSRLVRGDLVGYLGQDPASALHPTRRIGNQLREVARGTDVEALLDDLGLPHDGSFLRRYPHELSGGQAQRVALARALVRRPPLLVLDEPTSGLDARLALDVRNLLRDTLTRTGAAAVLISHDHALVHALADRVALIEGGRVNASGAPDEVLPVQQPRPPAPVATDSQIRLQVSGLSAWHGRHQAVREVSFELPAGGSFALVGPSGAGKTTVARCLVGLHPHATGRLELDGQPLALRTRRRAPAQRRRVALVAQNSADALNPAETVAHALRRPLRRLRGLSADAADREIDRLLDLVALPAACRDRRLGELSGGQRQRVNLVRALAAAPAVLVCDEITSALDPDVAAGVLAVLNDLREQLGVSVVLITHDLDLAARHAVDVGVLDGGVLVESGPATQVLAAPATEPARALVAATWPAADSLPSDTPTVERATWA